MKNPLRHFRFSLATLLLACILAGAVIGLFADTYVWRLEYSMPYSAGAESGMLVAMSIDAEPRLLALADHDGCLRMFDLNSRKLMWERPMVFLDNRNLCGLRFVQNVVQVAGQSKTMSGTFDIAEETLSTDHGSVLWRDHFAESNWNYAERLIMTEGPLKARANGAQFVLQRKSDNSDCAIGRATGCLAPNRKESATPQGTRVIFRDAADRQLGVLDAGSTVYAVRYLPDSDRLAVAQQGKVTIWWVARQFGWRRWNRTPYFWIAVATLAALGWQLWRRVREQFAFRR